MEDNNVGSDILSLSDGAIELSAARVEWVVTCSLTSRSFADAVSTEAAASLAASSSGVSSSETLL